MTRCLAIALVLLALAPGIAVAGFGDHRTITGHITLWGPNRFGQQIAVVQDDEGQRWVVRFSPGTLPSGAAVGTEVTIVGREFGGNELDVTTASMTSSVSALPSGAASGWAVVPGAVQDARENLAVIRANGGATVTVDMSELTPDVRT